MIAILTWTLWRRRWFTALWTLSLAGFMVLILVIYPAFRDQARVLNNSLNQLPATVKSFVADTDNYLSPVGYLSSNAYYLMLPLLFGVLCIGLGSSLLAQDERRHTMELLLCRPVSRGTLLLGRALAGLLILIIAAGITSLATIITAQAIRLPLSSWWLLTATMAAAGLGSIFGALAFMLTATGGLGLRISLGLPTFLLILSYLTTSLSSTVQWLSAVSRLLPYHYYHPAEILAGQAATPQAIGVVAVWLVLGVGAWLVFRRRDIA